MPPLVDIVVRTKDRPVFLRRALDSVRNQTFQDWRAVVVNDGGDPATVQDVVRDAGVADRVHVIDHEQALGRWPAANAGLRASEGTFLVLHDDDDTWHPEFLQRATDHLAARPDAVGVVSREEIVWEEFDGEKLVELDRETFQPQLSAPTLGALLLFNRFVPIGFLYRREIHEVLGEYREDLAVVGDWDFNLRVLSHWPLEFLADEPYAYWHQRRDASGSAGNSVIVESRSHRHFDALVRDAHLRELVQREGYGDSMYLTKFIDQRFLDLEAFVRSRIDEELSHHTAALHDRIDRLEADLTRTVWEASSIARAKQWVRRKTGRV